MHAICIVARLQINQIVIMKRCMKCSSAKQHCSMHADQPQKSHQTTYGYVAAFLYLSTLSQLCEVNGPSKLFDHRLCVPKASCFPSFVRSESVKTAGMEPITKRGEKTLREKQGSICPRRSEDEWTRQLLAKPSASRSGILRLTTPSCSGLFGQRHVDFQSVHSAGKKDFNVVQELNGFSGSPSCTSRVELAQNVDNTANDSDESTTTDQLQRATKKEFEGEGSLCHDACQRKELDRKQNQCSDKELSRQSRLPTDDVTLEQTLSNESCHRRGVRDKIFSSDSALVECEMTHSCDKPGLVSSSREASSFGPGVPQRKPWPHYGERPNAG